MSRDTDTPPETPVAKAAACADCGVPYAKCSICDRPITRGADARWVHEGGPVLDHDVRVVIVQQRHTV